jgi:hypothetical protein
VLIHVGLHGFRGIGVDYVAAASHWEHVKTRSLRVLSVCPWRLGSERSITR